MLRKLRPRSIYDVFAVLALFVAVSTGGAYAANTVFSTDIVDGEVKSVDIANNSIHSGDVLDNTINTFDVHSFLGVDVVDSSLTGADIQDGSIDSVDLAAGATKFAHVTSLGVLTAGNASTATKVGTGQYDVTWPTALNGCVGTASAGFAAVGGPDTYFLNTIVTVAVDAEEVTVRTRRADGTSSGLAADNGFNLVLAC